MGRMKVRMKLCWNCCKHYGLEPARGFKKYPNVRCETCGNVPGKLGIVLVDYPVVTDEKPWPDGTVVEHEGAKKAVEEYVIVRQVNIGKTGAPVRREKQ